MRRLLVLLSAGVVALVVAPSSQVDYKPWFGSSVGSATQVISVVGVGGSDAKVDVWQRGGAGWQPIAAAIPAKIGEKGISTDHNEGSMVTPMGVYSLDFAFGTKPNPGSGLQYVQVGPNHWWDGDSASPTYNTMQVCERAKCPFDTGPNSATENLQVPVYAHAVVMGVNKERIPDKGSAFFLHDSDGGATAGCVAIDDAQLVSVMRWLRPGAMIAVAK